MNQQIDYEQAKSLAQNIKTSAYKIKTLLDNSDSVVKKVQNNWQGVSADYALDDWDKWKKDFEEYYNVLMQNVTNIQNAATSFAENEAAMQKNFG